MLYFQLFVVTSIFWSTILQEQDQQSTKNKQKTINKNVLNILHCCRLKLLAKGMYINIWEIKNGRVIERKKKAS